MFKLLYSSSTSACFELNNKEIYYNIESYNVCLNGKVVIKNKKENVFSIFDLKPNTKYKVSIEKNTFVLEFATKPETQAISIIDFGAVADGKTINTFAIQMAINVVKSSGRVIVPKGEYLTGPLVLKSDMTLYLEKGAKIIATPDRAHYPIIPGKSRNLLTGEDFPLGSWEGEERDAHQPIISCYNASNVHIVGEGEIDGNGGNGDWYIDVKNQKIGRPRLLYPCHSENFYVHGITGGHSPSWNLHPFFCKNIGFYDIKVNADKDSPNTDGLDPEACENVEIIGVVLSVGDDCIALKSGKIDLAVKYKKVCHHITIRNCLMQYGHGAVVLGSEMAGGVKDFSVTQCLFKKTDRGLRIKTRRGRGKAAVIDNVLFENIKMENVLTPITMNMFYFCDPDGKTDYVQDKTPGSYEVDDRTPYLGKFTFKDMDCVDCEYAAGHFWGLPEQPIKEVNIENVNFAMKKDASSGHAVMMCNARESSKEGLVFFNVENVNLKNLTFNGVNGEIIESERVKKINKENIKIV